MPKEPYN